MAPAARLSGLQKDVLALYRSILREAVRKDRRAPPSHPPTSTSDVGVGTGGAEAAAPPSVSQLLSSSGGGSARHAREAFRREAASVRRSDFRTIEYKIRKGRKQLQLLKMPGVDLVGGAS